MAKIISKNYFGVVRQVSNAGFSIFKVAKKTEEILKKNKIGYTIDISNRKNSIYIDTDSTTIRISNHLKRNDTLEDINVFESPQTNVFLEKYIEKINICNTKMYKEFLNEIENKIKEKLIF